MLVVAEERSGSELLLSYLEKIEGAKIEGEVLSPWARIGIPAYMMFPRRTKFFLRLFGFAEAKLVVLKLMLHHLDWCGLKPRDIRAMYPDAKYIILYREDVFSQFLSRQIMRETGRHRIVDKNKRFVGSVRVDAEEFRQYAAAQRKKFQRLLEEGWLQDSNVGLLKYEDMVAAPNQVLNELITPLLGVLPLRAETDLVKQNVRRHEEVIENWSELEALASSDEARLILT